MPEQEGLDEIDAIVSETSGILDDCYDTALYRSGYQCFVIRNRLSRFDTGKIVSAWRGGSLEIVLSQYILDELLQRVRPKLNHRPDWSSAEIRDFVDSLTFLVDPIQVSEPLLRNRADQPVLGTFLAANASYLVTGDKDLLALSARYTR